MNEFFNALKNKRARKEYIKSIIVGLGSTLIDFLSTAVILYLAGKEHYGSFLDVFTGKTLSGIGYTPSMSMYLTSIMVSFILSVMFNYLMCVFFVYEYGNVGKNAKGLLKFCIFATIGLTITTIGSLICSNIFGLSGANVWWIKMVITSCVFVFNFFTRKYFVFNIALIRDDDNTINL